MNRRDKREQWLKKYQRLRGLQALLATHESAPAPDIEYIKDLNKRIREVRVQLDVMSDVGNENVGIQGESE
jgi:hypothetical protein